MIDRLVTPRRSAYLLICLAFAGVMASGALTLYVGNLQTKVNKAEERAYGGCVRANVMREMLRFAMTELGSPDRAARPEVQEQDCAALYPGGTP